MIWYIENPKYATRKLLELHKFSKVSRHKINTQKSLAFLNTNNERSERKIKEAIPFFIISKRIKYLGINLPMEANALYTEHKTLMKETKDDTNRWKDIFGEEKINIIKMTLLPKATYKFNAISIKLPRLFSQD